MFPKSYAKNTKDYKPALFDDRRNKIKKAELDKFMPVLFLRNANYDKCNKLLIEYQKAYTNNDCWYPETLQGMMDVMR